MRRGELRERIINNCPEEFEGQLLDWINDIESMLGDALGYFEISGVDDLHKIEDAKRAVEDVFDGLY